MSPKLLNFGMKPVTEVNRRLRLQCQRYANDILLSLCHQIPKVPVETLNSCSEEVTGGMRTNKLKLNLNRTAVLLVSPTSVLGSGVTSMLDGAALTLKGHVCSFQVLLLDIQGVVVTKRAYY